MTTKAKIVAQQAAASTSGNAPSNGSSINSDEPRPWLTDEDASGWRVRLRGKDAARGDVSPRTLKQSVLVELDDDEIAWLDRRAAEGGVTLAGAVKQLIEQARAGS